MLSAKKGREGKLMPKKLLAGATLVLMLVLAGCGIVSKASAKQAPINYTGSTLVIPLVAAWQEGYVTQYPQASVSGTGTGSGTGILWAGLGKATLGLSDAYLSTLNRLLFPTMENIPLVVAALAIDYHLPGVTHLNLNGAVLAAIYSGRITTWNAPAIQKLNPGVQLDDTTIVTLHRADSSGSTFLFTSYLHAQDPAHWTSTQVGTTVTWPSNNGNSEAEQGSGGMLQRCAQVIGCIAYLGVSYRTEVQLAGLGTASLANGKGQFVYPSRVTMETALTTFAPHTPSNGSQSLIDSKVGYPIINYEYAMVLPSQQDPLVAKSLRQFLLWDITTGSSLRYLTAVSFVPLPPNVRALAEDMIAKIR